MSNEVAKYSAVGVVGIVIGVAVVSVFFLGGNVTLSISPKSGIEFETERSDTLTDLIGEGLDAATPREGDDGATTAEKETALAEIDNYLAGRGYYKLENDRLVDEIRGMDAGSAAAGRLRQVLFDLQGPFERPFTFRNADGRLLDAFEDLHKGLKEEPEGDSEFFAELYTRLLDENSVFNAFNNQITAEVRLIPENPRKPKAIFSCPGSDLKKGSFVTVRAEIQNGGWIDSEMDQNIRFYKCATFISAQDFLGGKKVVVGVGPAAFDDIFPPVPAMEQIRNEGKGPAKIVVYPAKLAPRELVVLAQ